MENISRIVDKELLKGLALKSRKRSQNWDMFFVADDGRTFVIKKFKWFLRVCIFLFIAMFVALTISIFFLVRSEIYKNKYLNELNDAKKKIETLTLAKENLEAEKVIMLANRKSEGDRDSTEDIKEEKADKPVIVEEKALSAGKVFITKKAESRNYKSRFRLTNLTNKDKPINGYVFLILKKNDGTVDRVVPNVNLINEKPTNYRKGQYFSISRFKTVRFSFNRSTPPDAYKECYVLAYSFDGKLLLEKRSSIKVDVIVPQPENRETEEKKPVNNTKSDSDNIQETKENVQSKKEVRGQEKKSG